MPAGLCFAYGSNTDAEDWRAWCARNSVDPGCIALAGTARLPDRRLAFDASSPSRGGGVLNIRARIGGYVEGVLLRPTEAGWSALDRKQGVPGAYERVARTVIFPGGAAATASVYELARDRPRAFTPPADDYLRIVRRGYASHGIHAAPLEAAARNREGCHVLLDVFAYGTLMRGEVLHAHALRAGLVSSTPARTRGRLHDFGPYPAMTLDGAADAGREVHGEILTFADAATALPALDRSEEARPGCAPGGPYRRTIVTVRGASGRARPAWAYVVDRARVASVPIIPSGSWRRRRPA